METTGRISAAGLKGTPHANKITPSMKELIKVCNDNAGQLKIERTLQTRLRDILELMPILIPITSIALNIQH